jgi:osmotically-inducible protein OsmY
MDLRIIQAPRPGQGDQNGGRSSINAKARRLDLYFIDGPEVAFGFPGERIVNKADSKLKQAIEEDLRLDPRVAAAQVTVRVDHGAVSLKGKVATYPEKWAAEQAVWRVAAVDAAAGGLTVSIPAALLHRDAELAEAALNALKWDVWGLEGVTVQVHQGRILLDGQVRWAFERASAERAVRSLPGVVSVDNAIRIKVRERNSIKSVLPSIISNDTPTLEAGGLRRPGDNQAAERHGRAGIPHGGGARTAQAVG